MLRVLATRLLHGATQTAVPHWVVLLVAVPLLWLTISCGVVLVDRYPSGRALNYTASRSLVP